MSIGEQALYRVPAAMEQLSFGAQGGRRRPLEGDQVTLFAIPEICYWTRQGASTVRRWIASGKISADNITRPGGRIFMTGDQLARLIASWAGQPSQLTATEPKPRRRTRRHDPHKPLAGGRPASL
jgi:hypothetical protein